MSFVEGSERCAKPRKRLHQHVPLEWTRPYHLNPLARHIDPQMRFALARAYQRAGRTADAERERVAFAKLDRQLRTSRSGAQSVGGIEIDSGGAKPKAPR